MIGLGGDPNKIRHEGYYEDTYVKTAQGWRFKSRIHHVPEGGTTGAGRARGGTRGRGTSRSGPNAESLSQRARLRPRASDPRGISLSGFGYAQSVVLLHVLPDLFLLRAGSGPSPGCCM